MKAKSWGEIKEVDRYLVSIKNIAWRELFDELRLRLERTSSSKTLLVPFGEVALARSAMICLRKQFKYAMPGEVMVGIGEHDDGAVLEVSWKSRDHSLNAGRPHTGRRKVTDDYEE